MSKFEGWLLAIIVFVVSGLAVYEFAYIQHLQFIIRMLVSGNPN